MIHVTVLLLSDGLASVAVAPLEIFQMAGVLFNMCTGQPPQPRFAVISASVDGNPPLSDGGLAVVPDKAIAQVRKTDLVFVPDAGFDLDTMIDKHRSLLPWLRKMRAHGATIAGVCSGVGLVAAAGLLDGRRATTHWALSSVVQQRFPKVEWRTEAFITEDGDLICGGGIYSAIDLSLYLVERYCGHAVALECGKAMLAQMPRVWQAGYAMLPLTTEHADDTIRKAEDWLGKHYSGDLRVEDVAGRVGMSPRTFERRFRAALGESPRSYLQRIRVAAARRLLESGKKSVQEISGAVGYDDATFFRTVFKRHTGLSPAVYRAQFGSKSKLPRREARR